MEFTPQERKTFTLERGDLVLSEASGSASQVGKPAMWRGEIPDCCFQNTVIRHRLFGREQSPFYLWLYRFFYLHGIFSRTAGGVGINHLSAGKFSRLPVPLCSLPEQREIVRLLDEQFTVIEQNERELDAALKRSAALRQSILKKAFTGQLVPQDPADESASELLERIRRNRSEFRKKISK
jgi:type I restriction enzyme S subunit